MSTPAEKLSFPMISINYWWSLRDKFKNRMPSVLDDAYVSSALGSMSSDSIRANIRGPLKLLGIIDKDGAPTEIADLWRMDESYREACERIRESVYPRGLLDAVPDGESNITAATNWFMTAARVGEPTATRMAKLYALVCEADVNKRAESKIPSTSARKKSSEAPRANPKTLPKGVPDAAKVQEKIQEASHSGAHDGRIGRVTPSVHIDVQIHISPESTEKQIDQIFASMATHLYGNKTTNDQ